MMDVANSIETAIDTLTGTITNASQHTSRSENLRVQSQAMNAIEMNEGFSNQDLRDAAIAKGNDPQVANMYLTIKNKIMRKDFLLFHMENIRKPT